MPLRSYTVLLWHNRLYDYSTELQILCRAWVRKLEIAKNSWIWEHNWLREGKGRSEINKLERLPKIATLCFILVGCLFEMTILNYVSYTTSLKFHICAIQLIEIVKSCEQKSSTLVSCSVLIGLNILVQWAALLLCVQDVPVQILALRMTILIFLRPSRQMPNSFP